jgi:lipoprotein-releasing system permease protein
MWKGTEEGKLSPMTVFGWLALGIGVWAMGSLLSVMYGFEGALKERVLTAYPHVLVRPKVGSVPVVNYKDLTSKIEKVEGVIRVTPYIEVEMILESEFRSLGAVIQGLPQAEIQRKKATLKGGDLPDPTSPRAQAIVGNELARRLGLAVGSQIKVISPVETTGPMGLVPKSQVYEVVGIFSSGHYQFDEQYLYVSLEDAQDLLKKGDIITGWQVWGDSYESADSVQKSVSPILPETLEAQSWSVFNAA